MLKDSAAAFKRKILSLESKNETTTRKAERLHVGVRSLSESLKMEKKKSRMAIEQLLILTTAQHNELMSKFQEKIQDVHAEHDRAMCSCRMPDGAMYLTIRSQFLACKISKAWTLPTIRSQLSACRISIALF